MTPLKLFNIDVNTEIFSIEVDVKHLIVHHMTERSSVWINADLTASNV